MGETGAEVAARAADMVLGEGLGEGGGERALLRALGDDVELYEITEGEDDGDSLRGSGELQQGPINRG